MHSSPRSVRPVSWPGFSAELDVSKLQPRESSTWRRIGPSMNTSQHAPHQRPGPLKQFDHHASTIHIHPNMFTATPPPQRIWSQCLVHLLEGTFREGAAPLEARTCACLVSPPLRERRLHVPSGPVLFVSLDFAARDRLVQLVLWHSQSGTLKRYPQNGTLTAAPSLGTLKMEPSKWYPHMEPSKCKIQNRTFKTAPSKRHLKMAPLH